MMKRVWWRLVVSVCLALCLASPALGQSFTDCNGVDVGGDPAQVSSGSPVCFEYGSSFGVAASGGFFVSSSRARIVLDADTGGTAGSTSVSIQSCDPLLATDNTCGDTGLILSASNPGESITKGLYRFNVTAAAGASENVKITIRGY